MTEIEKIPPLRHCGTKEIKTERLLLRPFRKEDYKDIFVYASNPEVTKYLSYSPHRSLKDSEKIVKTWIKGYKKNTAYNWAIVYDGKVIGNINVCGQDDRCFECGLGWQIDIAYWNKGIMTEAAGAVVEYLFNKVGYQRIYSAHDSRNIGSGRVMQKIGMIHEGTMRQYYYNNDGTIGDREIYAILKSDYDNMKK